MRMSGAGRRLFLVVAALVSSVLVCPAAPAAAAPAVAITSADRLDLSTDLDLCESAPEADVNTIATGGCRFEPATPAALSRGYTTATFWLRLILVNPEPQPVERWLLVGNQRLEHVAFFEATTEGGWRRRDSGLAVPSAHRPLLSTDPILPVTLAAGESRTLHVRIASRTSINLATTLWRPHAYADVHGRNDFQHALAVGGLLVAALFSMMIALVGGVSRWSSRTNLFFSGSLLSKAVFNAANTGQLALYVLPNDWSFDLRINAVGMGGTTIFFVLFQRHFVQTPKFHPRFDLLFRFFIGLLLVEIAWAMAIDVRVSLEAIAVTSFVFLGSSVILLWIAWRNRLPGAGYLLIAVAINFALLFDRVAMAFVGGAYADTLLVTYSWFYLLTVPLIPIGMALHEAVMRHALESARKESAARVEFLARMSHELRTPLDTILGNAQLLSRPGGETLLADGLATIEGSGRHLLRMVDDILDHARSLAGRLTINPVSIDLPAFLHAVEADARRVVAANGNDFALHVGGTPLRHLRLDEGRLRQILANLIGNAARHTAHGRIDLGCVVAPAEDAGAVALDFTVRDTGEGIAPADLERIFLPFERGTGTVSRHGAKGLGMGLTIARQFVEMMGGHLTVDSRPGEGACFRFRIVAETANVETAPSAKIAERAAYAGIPRTLLVIDDADDNRRVLATFLRGRGFRVVEANSGRDAMARCGEIDRLDLVLTDQFMADGDGWMVLREMASRRPGTPVISISAAPLERPADVPEGLGFAAHLLKPLDHGHVLHCIGDLLGLVWEAPSNDTTAPAKPIGAHVDPAMMATLEGLIADGRISDIMSWANALKASDPRSADFADAVHAAARWLDFPKLTALSKVRDGGARTPTRSPPE